LYPSTEQPRFVRGHAVSLAMVAWAVCVYAFMAWYFTARNRERRDGKEDHKIQGMSDEQISELGDESPRYIFTV
ncbi:hypothetical protein LTR66_017262, partial [Elasticomyces elasticus]